MTSEAIDAKLSVGKSIAKERKGGKPGTSPRAKSTSQDAIRNAIRADQIDANELAQHEEVSGPGPMDSIDLEDAAEEKLYDVQHPTGNKIRDKVRKLLTDSMDKPEENVKPRDEIEKVAYAIENELFKKFDSKVDDIYRSKCRDLNFNLKDAKNTSLRHNVLNKLITLSSLLSMSNQELANDELKKTRKSVQDKMTRDAQPSTSLAASTDMFKCGKCKQRKCTYTQMQTRSADEPLTTFVTCVNCRNRWKFS